MCNDMISKCNAKLIILKIAFKKFFFNYDFLLKKAIFTLNGWFEWEKIISGSI